MWFGEGKRRSAYRVDSQVPVLARTGEINDHLFIRDVKLFEGDMGAVSPGTEVVGVEGDLWGGAVCGSAGAIGCESHDRLALGSLDGSFLCR